MAMVSITFKMDVREYVKMTEVIAAQSAGLRATAENVSTYIRRAVEEQTKDYLYKLKTEDSGCDLGKTLFEVDQ